ncbi:Protein of unknown function [Agromyces sp. CF514]|uniref:DUF3054 domain-containing protein n=1 Tax=Agromyces sp. CF514 TaxID=1881031 RepID=UPI0008E1C310|nr:DUF3054 domain-containing protein [Agromyces sp. CF514]SFR73308.1 Protein of unknown function [Agromyces sp. CF514]
MTSPLDASRQVGAAPQVVALAAALDAALVVVFAVIGRSSHAEGLDLAGVWGTAWPFLVGAAVGWLVVRAWRAPFAVWPTGVVIWLSTVVVGMLLRLASGQGTAVAFIVVATVTLAVLLLGWRAIALLVVRARRRGGVRPAASDSASASGTPAP